MELAGLGDEFQETGAVEVVERLDGTGMTDFYGVSGRTAARVRADERSGCERKLALLRACWAYFDSVAGRVSADLRLGPRGGGRDRDRIVRHANGAEIQEFAPKVGVKADLWIIQDPPALGAYRDAFGAAIREHNARGPWARRGRSSS